jgi:hypothetical protein
MGTAAAGAGAVFGSGAFTQVEAQRDLTIGVDDDSEALIGIKAGANVTSVDEAESGDNEGELVIDTNKLSGGNEGFAVGSTVDIGDIESGDVVDGGEAFSVTNNFDDVGDGTGDIDIAIDLTGIDLDTVSGLNSLEFYGTGPNGTQVTSAGGRKVYDVRTDEVIDFAIRFKTASTTGPSDLDATVTFQAGSDLTSEDFPATQPVDTVIRSSDGEDFTSIQTAVDDSGTSSGETLRIGAGTFDESVTIDVEGLTLEAGDGPSPTVDASGINGGSIPVLVDGASGVTVDDSINFKSGIDVGADIPDYSEVAPEAGEFDLAVTDDGNVPGEGDFNEGETFESINAAVDDADAGDSILVFPGTYDEQAGVGDDEGFSFNDSDADGLRPNLNIVSKDGPADTTIIGDNRIIKLRADGVTIKGFKLDGNGQQAVQLTDASNVNISHNIVAEDVAAAQGIDLFADQETVNNVVIENNVVNGQFSRGAEVSVSGGENVQVMNNEIEGQISSSGTTNLQIVGNSITNYGESQSRILLTDNPGGDVEDAVVKENEILNDPVGTTIGFRTDGSVTIDEFVNNDIIDSGTAAVANTGETPVDATNNFFGSADTGEFAIIEQPGDVNFRPFSGVQIGSDAGDDGEE